MFGILAGAHTNDALLAIEREISPRRARALERHPAERRRCSARIDALWQRARQPRPHRRAGARAGALPRRCSRAGAALDAAASKRLAEITERLATLGTAFSQNVLADEQAYTLALDGEDDLAGLPDFVRAGRDARRPSERGLPAST